MQLTVKLNAVMQPVARTRVVSASFVLLFATGRGVYLHAFVCQNILNTTEFMFYSRVCSYLNTEVNPAQECICHVAPPYFSIVHGVHGKFHTYFTHGELERGSCVIAQACITLDPCGSSVKLCRA